jgi:hypothetical protein
MLITRTIAIVPRLSQSQRKGVKPKLEPTNSEQSCAMTSPKVKHYRQKMRKETSGKYSRLHKQQTYYPNTLTEMEFNRSRTGITFHNNITLSLPAVTRENPSSEIAILVTVAKCFSRTMTQDFRTKSQTRTVESSPPEKTCSNSMHELI